MQPSQKKTALITSGLWILLMLILLWDAASPDWVAIGTLMVALVAIELDGRDRQSKDMLQVKLDIQKIKDKLNVKDKD